MKENDCKPPVELGLFVEDGMLNRGEINSNTRQAPTSQISSVDSIRIELSVLNKHFEDYFLPLCSPLDHERYFLHYKKKVRSLLMKIKEKQLEEASKLEKKTGLAELKNEIVEELSFQLEDPDICALEQKINN